MSFREEILSDVNANVRHPKSNFNMVKDKDEETQIVLFPELDELSANPEKFLAPDCNFGDQDQDLHEVGNDYDMELLEYFELDSMNYVNPDCVLDITDSMSISNSIGASDVYSENENESDMKTTSTDSMEISNILKQKRDLCKSVSVVLDRIKVVQKEPLVNDIRQHDDLKPIAVRQHDDLKPIAVRQHDDLKPIAVRQSKRRSCASAYTSARTCGNGTPDIIQKTSKKIKIVLGQYDSNQLSQQYGHADISSKGKAMPMTMKPERFSSRCSGGPDIIQKTSKKINNSIVLGQNDCNQLSQQYGHAVASISSKGKAMIMKPEKFSSRCSNESSSPSPTENNLSKSAVAARENRQKKKQYVSELENKVKSLLVENVKLDTKVGGMEKLIKSLQTEVQYLSSVLANEGALASVLKNICSTPGVKFAGGGLIKPCNYPDESCLSVFEDEDSLQDQCRSKKPCLVDLRRFDENTSRSQLKRLEKNDHDYASALSDGEHTAHLVKPVAKVEKYSKKTSPTVSNTASLIKPVTGRVSSHFKKPGFKKSPDGLEKIQDAGVCLHVSKNVVSMEFCSRCNNTSQSRVKGEDI